MPATQKHIIFFDGVCNLCNRSVQWVVKQDKKGVFKFASLQSPAAKNILEDAGISAGHFQSFVYVKNGEVLTKSDAALEVAETLGGKWKIFYYLRIVPKFIRDFIYNLVAKNRYRWFGKKEECMIPTPELKDRFV